VRNCKICGTVLVKVDGSLCEFCYARNKHLIRTCEWCGDEFIVKSAFSQDKYCSDEHKKEAKKDKTNQRVRKYRKQNKLKDNLRTVGTTTISPHPMINSVMKMSCTYLGVYIPYLEFYEEQKLIQNERLRNTSVSTSSKGKRNNNFWIDYTGTMEYGSKQPIGIQITHNYANFNDYFNMAVSYWMETSSKCPECGSTHHLRDVSRAEISCECGLLLAGPPHRSVTYPTDNYPNIPIAKYSHEHKWKKRRVEDDG